MYIVADIGGTKTRVAGSRDLSQLTHAIVMDSIPEYEAGVKALVEAGRRLAESEAIEGVCAGITGVVREGMPVTAPHHEGWKHKPLAADLSGAFGARARVENDTALVGLGEAVFGGGRGARIVAYITVSTGVNGVRIVDGAVDHSSQGFEIGGQYLSPDAKITLEDLISGRAIRARFGCEPKELGIDSPVWGELARLCAVGVHNTILHWSPDRVVLGGSMFNEIGIKADAVAARVGEIMRKFPAPPQIMHSQLGDFGGLWGGMARLKQLQR